MYFSQFLDKTNKKRCDFSALVFQTKYSSIYKECDEFKGGMTSMLL